MKKDGSLMTRLLLPLVLLFATPRLWAAVEEPPIAGRPMHFSGAIGGFRASMSVDSSEVQVEQPFTLTLRIEATGRVDRAPVRPDLRDFDEFPKRFFIDPVSDEEGTRPDENTWEFRYRLKARTTDVDSVPRLPFIFYKPPASRGLRGSYQTSYARSVPLTVKPPAPVKPPTPLQPETINAPASAFQIIEGTQVLASSWSFHLPLWLILLVLLATPFSCLAWYLAWQRLYPDAARLARRRRSRAARTALRSLESLTRQPDEKPLRSARIVTAYLQQRFDFQHAEPSPDEVTAHLHEAGVSAETTTATVQFLRDGATARYAPIELVGPRDWIADGVRLVNLLENEAWSRPS